MTVKEAAIRVQFAYPKIYLACHSQHQNARTSQAGISQRDASILAHLSRAEAIPQNVLARHLGLAKSTLSEALAWLEKCAYVSREPDDRDPRVVRIRLTDRGQEAMSGGSVLQSERLNLLLEQLSKEDRTRAVDGLELLARAALTIKGRKK